MEQQKERVQKKRNTSKDYIDNKKFYEAMVDHRKKYLKTVENGESPPIISDYIGECIYHIAHKLSFKPNFINYSYKDEMISDGMENCLLYLNNFDPEKTNNPFAYFTQIIYYAFIRRITKEKKQTYTKFKYAQNSGIFDMLDTRQDGDDDTTDNNAYLEYIQLSNDVIKNFEDGIKKKANKRKKGLEKFYKEEEE